MLAENCDLVELLDAAASLRLFVAMAEPSPSSADVLPVDSLKISSSAQAPAALRVSDSVGDDTPAPSANGITEQQPGAHNTTHSVLDDSQIPQISDSAAGPSVGTGQGPTLTAPTTTEPAAPISTSPGVSAARESLQGGQKDKDGDKPGLSPSKVPSSPPSPSQVAPAAPATTSRANGASKKKSASISRSSKPSFFSKLLRAFVPCVSSSPAHPIEIDDNPSASGSKEKRASTSTERVSSTVVAPVAPVKVATPPQATEPVALTPVKTVIPIPDTPPPAEGDIFIPPTPPPQPHILPLEETEGVTSGAVQAPGSTGGSSLILENKRHSRDSTPPSHASAEEESEGTSFTEDEDMDGLDDLEDDEDKLILSGGAGIPIGPVS